MTSIKSGIEESLIDHFTLQSSFGYDPVVVASGQMKGADKDFIYIEIVEGDFAFVLSNCDNQYFDIKFHINRGQYQIQHRAIEYFEKHNVHSMLINNPKYDRYEDYVHHLELDGLNGKLAKDLNDEQKMAVMYIAKSNNYLPYLLFGPAGEFSKTMNQFQFHIPNI